MTDGAPWSARFGQSTRIRTSLGSARVGDRLPSKTSASAPRISTARFSLHRCAILPLILLLAVATNAVEPEMEAMCAYTAQTPDGKFKLVPSETLRLLGANSAQRADQARAREKRSQRWTPAPIDSVC